MGKPLASAVASVGDPTNHVRDFEINSPDFKLSRKLIAWEYACY